MRELRVALPALQLWARLRIQGALRRRLDPEDLVQETCIRAYASADGFDPRRGSFRAWLLGIAAHVMLNELRTMRRRPADQALSAELGVGSAELDAFTASLTSITSAAARQERIEALTQKIETLDERDRWVLVYRGIEELPYEEVGRRLSMNPEAARTRYRRCLEQLRFSQELVRFAEEA